MTSQQFCKDHQGLQTLKLLHLTNKNQIMITLLSMQQGTLNGLVLLRR